jgi:uncharacterized protein (DUF849 family)
VSDPAIITVAITGSVPKKSDTPAVPVTPEEQIESTHEAYEAGASLVHIHVRNPDQTPSSSPDLFARVQEGVSKHCPGMIIQFSTGGRGRTRAERALALDLKPEMASLSTGSCNFTNWIFENPPDFVDQLAQIMKDNRIKPEIEVFDVSMLYSAISLAERGLISRPLHVQFVMGVQNALPVRRTLLEFLIGELKAIEPAATWAAIGLGRHQLEVNRWCLELGGHVRTGLEDNIKFDRNRLAKSNAELVARVAQISAEYGRRPATVAEARAILGLVA